MEMGCDQIELRTRTIADESRHRAAACFAHGCECESAGLLHDAFDAFEKAIACNPHDSETYFNAANVLRGLGRSDRARMFYATALQRDPSMVAAWYNLSDLHDDCGDVNAAIWCLQQAIAFDPHYTDAHFNLADCLERAGRDSEAVHHWARYLMLDSHSEWSRIARQALARPDVKRMEAADSRR